jgi:transcriptional regulator with XRE-family HTH domain
MKYIKDKIIIKEEIKAARERLGISKQEMGKILGMTGQAYSLYENGKNNPPAWKYLKIITLKKKDLK